MLKLGEVYTWDEIVEAYPNKFAFITDVNKVDGEINTCKLLAISNMEDRAKYIKKYSELGIKFQWPRTTSVRWNTGLIL